MNQNRKIAKKYSALEAVKKAKVESGKYEYVKRGKHKAEKE